MKMKLQVKYRVLLASLIVAALLVLVTYLLVADTGTIGNVFVISLFIIVIPYFLYEYAEYIWLKSVEKQVPNFIRDLADSKRSGMSLPEAVHICSKTNYGKLTQEVNKMSNRLTWGTSFIRVIEIFNDRVRKSKIITEALEIIKEAYKSGGNITATLDSVAKDIRTLQDAEDQRKSLVRQHVMIMYAIFFIFLAVSITIIYVMVPMMQQQPETQTEALAFQFVNPCPVGIAMFPCDAFLGICAVFDVLPGISCYYIALFFFILIIQGIFSGLIAGQLGENSVIAGSKHSIIMVSAAISIFMFLAKLGMLPT
jgi:flagellar protein FlaJ